MPAERIGMRDAREIIRLKFSGVSTHEIARRLGMARSTVRETLKRADVAGLAWPLPEDMTDGALEAALYASRRSKRGHRRMRSPTGRRVHRELKRKHVTLSDPVGRIHRREPRRLSLLPLLRAVPVLEKTLSVTMRQTHAAGEKLFVDYAGDGVPVVVDRLTGEIRMAQIFVAVLGASSFTFAKATWTQALPDWIDAHVRAFEAIGGVPELVVPDNAKTAVIKACLYDPAGQPNLCRDGGALRNRHPAGEAEEAARQGEGRAGGPDRRALVARPARRRIFHSLADVDAAIGELWRSSTKGRPCAGSASPAANCSKRSTARRSSRCRASPMCSASGACAGSASTITSTSTPTIIPCPTASPAPRSRRA